MDLIHEEAATVPAKKSLAEWTVDDVQEWLEELGMAQVEASRDGGAPGEGAPERRRGRWPWRDSRRPTP